jgi:hypothetical protein
VRKTGNNPILLRAIGYILAGTGWTHDSCNWPTRRYANSACRGLASHKRKWGNA